MASSSPPDRYARQLKQLAGDVANAGAALHLGSIAQRGGFNGSTHMESMELFFVYRRVVPNLILDDFGRCSMM